MHAGNVTRGQVYMYQNTRIKALGYVQNFTRKQERRDNI